MDIKKLLPAGTILLLLSLASLIHQQWQKLPVQALNANLAYANFEGLFVLEQGGHNACSTHDLKKSAAYFSQVTRLMPGMADAWGMLGFCYFHLGQRERSIEVLQKAIAINPHFWGFYYNLGVVYLQQKNFDKAGENFQKSLTAPPPLSALFIRSSKIYSDLMQKSKHQDIDLAQRLQDGYKLSFLGAQMANSHSTANLPLRLF